MATFFRNSIIKDIGTVPILAVETNAGTNATIIGMSLSNLTDFPVYASVLVNGNDSVNGYYLKDVMIPPNSSLKAVNGGEKLILSPENQLYVVADETESLDAVISYVDIV